MTRRQWLAATIASWALLAAACGGAGSSANESGADAADDASSTTSGPGSAPDSDDGDTDDGDTDGGDTDSSSTEEVVLTASAPGVTEDTIHLGFLAVDFPTLLGMGLVDLDPGDPDVVIEAFVDEINDRGGILGRRIEPHLEVVLPIGSTDAEAACLRLTEDVRVFAVLGGFAGPSSEVNPCITDLHETIMVGGQPRPEQLERARAPWITELMSSGRRLAGAVDLFHDAGLLGERLAVAMEATEIDLGEDVVVARLEELGYDVVVKVVQDAPPSDLQARANRWDTFIERFRTEDVDTVVLVETVVMGGSNAIKKTELDVQVVAADATNYVNILTSIRDATKEQLVGVIGTTGATPEEAWEVPATQECVDIFEAANPEIEVVPSTQVPPGETVWISTVAAVCARLRLFEAIATAAGADLTHESFLAAAESLGEIELPAVPFASLGPGKFDAGDALRLSEWDPTVDEDGGSSPYGPLTRIG